jgi:hypothetical protein
MTLRVIDGFDYFPTGQTDAIMLGLMGAAGWYVDSSSFPAGGPIPLQPVPGRFGFGNGVGYNRNVLFAGGNLGRWLRPLPLTIVTGFVGFGYYRGSTTTPETIHPHFTFFDAVANDSQVTVYFEALGVISVYRGDRLTGTLLGSSLAGMFQQDEWFQVEIKCKIDPSAGIVEVRINTVVVLSLINVNTQKTTHAYFDTYAVGYNQVGGSSGSWVNFALDDFCLLDTAGAVNNNYLGTVRVWTQKTAGAGALTQFSKFGTQPTNWQTVQNQLADDSQYVYDGTTGDIDLYTVQALVTGPSVHGVQIRSAFRQDDATQVNAHNVLKSAGTQVEGADHFINQTYTYYNDIWELDPHTGVGWSGTGVNALQIGPKKNA